MKTYNLISWTRDGKEVVCATTEANSKEQAERQLQTFAIMACDGVYEIREEGK